MKEVIAAALLVLSGLFVLVSAMGFVRPGDFFVRMHPPALAYTLGTWSVSVAGILVYSTSVAKPALHPLLIMILLFITVPVTSLLLARAVLFRRRSAEVAGTPPPLRPATRNSQQHDDAGGESRTSQD